MTQESLFETAPDDATITEIVALKSDPNQRRIRIGRRTVATLRASDVDELKLEVGAKWTRKLQALVDRSMAADRVRKAAMTMLGRRSMSRSDLVSRLVNKGHAKRLAEQVTKSLVADGWLNEQAFAEAIVNRVAGRKPASDRLIREKLQAKGINSKVIAKVTRSAGPTDAQLESLRDFAERRLASMSHLPRAGQVRRISGLIARRGFDQDVIESVLSQIGITLDD